MGSDAGHVPVLLAEALERLAVRPGALCVDGTVGLGGHAAAMLRASAPGGRLFGFDKDGETLAAAQARLAEFGARVRLEQADYREIPERLAGERPDAILLDLGVSSLQLDDPGRGFSFQAEGPLDMRMDRSGGTTAADLVNGMRESDLADLIFECGDEPASRRIARAIVRAREAKPIETTTELADIVRRAAPRRRPGGIHPATRTFQALRIRVNRELEGLREALVGIAGCLAPGGRMAVIAFHSLEDRAVKETFRALSHRCVCPRDLPVCGCGRPDRVRTIGSGAVQASGDEARDNPRSRSARLRAVERL
jgi:16S rRNA (cytosine1402-N4)-methyltransferase